MDSAYAAATPTLPATEALTTCRICAGKCALRLTLDAAGRVIAIHGDRSDPLTRGYACIKGLQLAEAHYRFCQPSHPGAMPFSWDSETPVQAAWRIPITMAVLRI